MWSAFFCRFQTNRYETLLSYALLSNVLEGLSDGNQYIEFRCFFKRMLFRWHGWFASFKPSFVGAYFITHMSKPLTKYGSTDFTSEITRNEQGTVRGQDKPCWEIMVLSSFLFPSIHKLNPAVKLFLNLFDDCGKCMCS